MKIDFHSDIFNPVYFPYYYNRSRYLLIYGGGGSGKSEMVASKLLMRMMLEPGHRFIITRKIARTIRNSQFRLLKDIINRWGLWRLFDIYETDMRIVYRPNGSEIISAGLNDPERLKSITQPTGIWFEEATEGRKKDFDQLDLRLRGLTKYYKQLILTFNPISRFSYIYKKWFTPANENLRAFDIEYETAEGQITASILKTTYLDNRFIDREYRIKLQLLEAEDENDFRIYAKGEWGVPPKGLIYKNWSTIPEWHEGIEPIHGLDFGFAEPTSLVRIGRYEDEIIVDELIYDKGLTNGDLIEKLPLLVPKRKFIYGDSGEPQRIEEIRRSGHNIHPAHKAVEAGIDVVRGLKLRITEQSGNILKEIAHYKWKEDKDGEPLDEPVKYMDHSMDAIRYGVYSHHVKIPGYWGNKKPRKSAGTGGRSTERRERRGRSNNTLERM